MKKYFILVLLPLIFGCNNSNSLDMKNVTWKTLTGIKMNPEKTLVKTTTTAWDNNYAISNNFLSKKRNGRASLILGDATSARFFGLQVGDQFNSFKTIDYTFYITSNNRLGIWENAKPQGEYFKYAISDTLTISKHKSNILYKLNNKTLKVSALKDTTKLLHVVASIHKEGVVMNPVKCNF